MGPVDSLRDTLIRLHGQVAQEGSDFVVIGAKVQSEIEVSQ
jgi:hypothetical protein